MKLGLFDYVKEAFNARPWGMLIPPNWIGLGAFGLLGFLNPGLWILGAGAELGYLYSVGTNPRFQRLIQARRTTGTQRQEQVKLDTIVTTLVPEDQRRYRALERRCWSIVEQLRRFQDPGAGAQGEGLGRLLLIFLRLLVTRRTITQVLTDASGEGIGQIEERIRKLEKQIAVPSTGEDLKKSLQSQLEILQSRLEGRREARRKLEFLDAELTRIEEQAELIREQAVLAADPASVSTRIDQISATLGGTTQWIKEQQQIYGQVQDLLEVAPSVEPPPPQRQSARESQ